MITLIGFMLLCSLCIGSRVNELLKIKIHDYALSRLSGSAIFLFFIRGTASFVLFAYSDGNYCSFDWRFCISEQSRDARGSSSVSHLYCIFVLGVVRFGDMGE